MLEIKVNANTPRCQIVATGTTKDLLVEICMVINSLYNTMHKQDRLLAEIFRREMEGIVSKPNSPLWELDAIPGEGLAIFTPAKRKGEDDG